MDEVREGADQHGCRLDDHLMASVLIPRVSNWPFRRLTVDGHYSRIARNVFAVQWVLDRTFIEPGPWTFTLLRFHNPTETESVGLEVATAQDAYLLEDRSADPGSFGVNLSYGVRLQDGNGVIYESQRVTTQSYWGKRDWLLAREIVRKDTLLLQKKVGVRGWLLKRRITGDPCPRCVGPDGAITDPQCPVCYGTGVVGGYYPAYEYWVCMSASKRLVRLTSDKGLIAANTESAWGHAYPTVDPQDIWVNYHTGDRYRVQSEVAETVRHRGIPLRIEMSLNLQPNSSSIYNVPLPADPGRPPCDVG